MAAAARAVSFFIEGLGLEPMDTTHAAALHFEPELKAMMDPTEWLHDTQAAWQKRSLTPTRLPLPRLGAEPGLAERYGLVVWPNLGFEPGLTAHNVSASATPLGCATTR